MQIANSPTTARKDCSRSRTRVGTAFGATVWVGGSEVVLAMARPADLVVECLQADDAAKVAVSLGAGHVKARLELSGV